MNDILKNSLFLIFTVIIVHFIFSGFIRPEANLIIETAKNTQTSVPRNFYIIVKDLEQEVCFILLIWGVFLILQKCLKIINSNYLFNIDLIERQIETKKTAEEVINKLNNQLDKNLQETAERETEEEVNISKDKYQVIGHFPKFYTGTGYVVTPYLGIINKEAEFQKKIKLNDDEVEKIFFAKTDLLLSPQYHIRDKPPINSSMHMTWKINYDNENIWGLTARVLVTISAGFGLREFPPCDDI